MAAAALDARINLTLSAMGEYTHAEEHIVDEVRRAISGMAGSWGDRCADVMSYIPYGFSFTETAYRGFAGRATLAGMQTLNQSRCRFEGKGGAIEWVIYQQRDGREIKIPYTSGLHLKNQSHLLLDSSDPRGLAVLEKVKPLHDAYEIMLVAIVLASQRQATPIIIQKTNLSSMLPMLDSSGRPILGSDGQPILISAGQQAQEKLEELENGSVAVIDRLDEIQAIAQQTDGKLLLQGIDFLLGMMALSVLMPRSMLLTNAGGVGDSTLADAQHKILRQVISRDVKKLGEGLIESVIRPMLEWNYGEMEDYGSFPVKEEGLSNAAQMIAAISTSVSQGALSGFESDASTRIRQLAGIS
jgi:hypothetical protein